MSTYTQQYGQLDSRWAGELLGYNADRPFTIGNYGCLITAYGNMLWQITGDATYTPEWMNNWLKNHNAFVPDTGVLYWTAPLALGHVEAHGTSADLNAVNTFLADPANYAILEVKAGRNQHFVLAPLVGQIIDSEDGRLKPMSTYPFVNAHLYRAVGGSGSGVAPIITNQEEPPMTPQQEEQAYEIVLGRKMEAAPTGRTGFQFIVDAQGETTAQRVAHAAEVAALTGEVTTLQTELAAAKLAALPPVEPLLSPEPVIVPVTVPVDTITAEPPTPVYTPTETKTVADRLHSVSAQGYGLLKKFQGFLHNIVFK